MIRAAAKRAHAFTDMYAPMILVAVSPDASPPWFYMTANDVLIKASPLPLLPWYLSHVASKPVIALLQRLDIYNSYSHYRLLMGNVRGDFKTTARDVTISFSHWVQLFKSPVSLLIFIWDLHFIWACTSRQYVMWDDLTLQWAIRYV